MVLLCSRPLHDATFQAMVDEHNPTVMQKLEIDYFIFANCWSVHQKAIGIQ